MVCGSDGRDMSSGEGLIFHSGDGRVEVVVIGVGVVVVVVCHGEWWWCVEVGGYGGGMWW